MSACDRDMFDWIAAGGSIAAAIFSLATAIFSFLVWKVYSLQLEMQKKQLQKDLVDYYMRIYQPVFKGCQLIMGGRERYADQAGEIFKEALIDAEVLFSQKVVNFVTELKDDAFDMATLSIELTDKDLPEELRLKKIHQLSALAKKFNSKKIKEFFKTKMQLPEL